ncbi:hypothetical protein BGZ76_006161 [Entomortierella beljakovae]|nr:hypothetical protein BGZ76_006161 [Entomortierella beljakovae]
MKSMTEPKNSSSFEVVSIDGQGNHEPNIQTSSPNSTSTKAQGCMNLSPRGRLIALAAYLMISGASSLYFSLIQASMRSIDLCETVAGCLFYSTQGWPALGQQTIDLFVMSYISGIVSVIGGILGAFGIYAAYKESATKVRLFARAWRFMIGIMIGSTILTLFLTVIHKERFLNQCFIEHDTVLETSECGTMYAAALLGSLIGCLIGVTMIPRRADGAY